MKGTVFASLGILLAGLVAAVAVLPRVAGSQTAPAPMPKAWTQFRLNDSANPVIAYNGTPSWTVQTDGGFSSSPAIVGGVVYLGNNAGETYAIDLATGNVRWTYQVKNPIMSNPLVYDGLVIIGEGNADSTTYVPRRNVQVGTGPNALIALNADTGAVAWTLPLAGTGMPTPVITDGVLVHHNGSGDVIGVDPRNGKLLWSHDYHSIASMVGLLPMPGNLVVTTGLFPNRVFAVDARNGNMVWQYQLSSNDSGVGDCPPVSDGKNVYGDYIAPPDPKLEAGVGVPGVERVYALDGKTGEVLWNVPLESGMVGPRNESAIPLIAHNTLYVGSAIAPYMHAIDTTTGKVLWSVKVGGAVLGGVVEHDGTIYFGDRAGNLWALNASTGAVIGKIQMPEPYNVGSPVIVGSSLIIGSAKGDIDAVPLDWIRSSSVSLRRFNGKRARALSLARDCG